MVPEEIHDFNVFMTDVKHVLKIVRIGNDKNRLKKAGAGWHLPLFDESFLLFAVFTAVRKVLPYWLDLFRTVIYF